VTDRRVTYLGHATVALERDGTRLLTDPLLRPSLMRILRRRSELPALDPTGLDAILISHAHHDHLDLPTLRGFSRHVPLFVPAGAGALLRREGFVSVTEVEPGVEIEVGTLPVRVVEAVHDAPRRRTAEPPSVGYLVGAQGELTYFPGDTEVFGGMAEIAEAGVDLALLPVWGWGPTLGAGHMNPEQAAEALALLRADRAVPIHWGTYSPIGASRLWPWMSHRPPLEFAEHAGRLAPGSEVTIPEPGEAIAALGAGSAG